MPQLSQGTAHFCIVLIDDEALLCQTVQDILANSPIALVLCQSPALALSTIQQAKPDLVLLDIYLEDYNGLDILSALKQDVALQHIPVMMLTANAQREMVERSMALGAVDYLVKPFTVSYFKKKVTQWLGESAFPPLESPSLFSHQTHIRILEPDLSLQKLLTAVLKEQGYHVECLSSTQQIPRYKGLPQLVILNSQLLDTSLYLKQYEEHHIPVLHWQDVERSSESQPFSVRHLVQQVKQVLSEEQS
jgi:DNA-binding response OmpR family regulator